MRELEGKIAIITGGAQGIGAAGAKELAFQGASVTIMDIDEKAAIATTEAINASGGVAVAVIADASTSEGCQKAVSRTLSEYDGVDILFNNVGIQPVNSYTNIENTACTLSCHTIHLSLMDFNPRYALLESHSFLCFIPQANVDYV